MHTLASPFDGDHLNLQMATLLSHPYILGGTGGAVAIVFLLALAICAIVAGGTLVARWELDSLVDLPMELISRLLPNFGRTRGALRHRFMRAMTSDPQMTLNNEKVAPRHALLRIAPEDAPRLAIDGDLYSLADNAVRGMARHAYLHGWQVNDSLSVSVVVDYEIRAGWIPKARHINVAPANAATATLTHAEYLEEVAKVTKKPTSHTQVGSRPKCSTSSSSPSGYTKVAKTQKFDNGSHTPEAKGRDDRDPRPQPGPVLVLAYDGQQHRVHGLGVVGRDDSCDVVIPVDLVSATHLLVSAADGKWWAKDNHSTNGTVLDGGALIPGVDYQLQAGMTLVLGHGGPTIRVLRAETSGSYTERAGQSA